MIFEGDYNKIYSENDKTFSAGMPEKNVSAILKYKTSGSVFEIGAGQGRNALFLARNGFDVTAQDLEQKGIDQLQEQAGKQGIKLKTEIGDIRTFKFEKDFDVFVATYMFQHLQPDEGRKLIQQIKEHTKSGGLNAIAAFTKRGYLYDTDVNQGNFYLEKDELKVFYSDWEILEYEGFQAKTLRTKQNGEPATNSAAYILARKK